MKKHPELPYLLISAAVAMVIASPAPVAAQLGDCWECVRSDYDDYDSDDQLPTRNTRCAAGSWLGQSNCMQIGTEDHHRCQSYGGFCILRWDDADAITSVADGSPPVTLGYLARQDEIWVIRKCGEDAPLSESLALPETGGGHQELLGPTSAPVRRAGPAPAAAVGR